MSLTPMPATEIGATDVNAQLATMKAQLDTMQRFVARRFDEISMEIHATSDLLGMAEDNLAQRFGEVLGVLSAITFQGDGLSQHNVGIELDAVVKTNEAAANQILDAAMAIQDLLGSNEWDNAQKREELRSSIAEQAQNVLVACSFQDLTGQRIAKTLERIRRAEAELSETLKSIGLNIEQTAHKTMAETLVTEHEASSQDDIDALFR